MKDGQQLLDANIKLKEGFPTRTVKVHLKWEDGRPPGEVTIMAKADQGDNPAARDLGNSEYEFTLLESTHYTISAWEDLDPQRLSQRHGQTSCTIPARIASDTRTVDGADADTSEITLTFVSPPCN